MSLMCLILMNIGSCFDGLSSMCKACKKLYSKENSIKLTERAAQWNKEHPEKVKEAYERRKMENSNE